MGNPQKVVRYGQEVWEDSEADAIRKVTCLCLRCANIRPGAPQYCPIAQDFYNICRENGVALMVTRCAKWVPARVVA